MRFITRLRREAMELIIQS